MKKYIYLMVCACLVCFTMNCNICFAESEQYVKVIYSSIDVYEDANINVDANSDGENLDVVASFKYAQKLKLVNSTAIQGLDGLSYYLIEFNNGQNVKQGYVLYSQVLLSTIASPEKELDYNATLNKDATLYSYENQQYVELTQTLVNGQKVKLLDGYNKANEYSRIQYKDSEGNILTAYVKTADISVSGISRATIGAIIIIVTTVSLVLVVFGIKGRKKKKA